MKQLKKTAALALAATALAMTLGASGASATTLEIGGVTQNKSVDINVRVDLGNSTILKTTTGSFTNTCIESRLRGSTEFAYTGTTVTARLSTMSFSRCTNPVTVHNSGTMHIQHIAGTTNGTVSSSGAEITVFSSEFGVYLNCKTGLGTHLGTLTGTAGGFSSFSTMHVNAVLGCGFFVPSAKWEGTYSTTWAEGLGVSA